MPSLLSTSYPGLAYYQPCPGPPYYFRMDLTRFAGWIQQITCNAASRTCNWHGEIHEPKSLKAKGESKSRLEFLLLYFQFSSCASTPLIEYF